VISVGIVGTGAFAHIIVAHESATRGGELREVPDLGDPRD
jgi:hypothetical protein